MARIEFECDTPGCGNVIHAEVPAVPPRSKVYGEVECTNCKAVLHVHAVILREAAKIPMEAEGNPTEPGAEPPDFVVEEEVPSVEEGESGSLLPGD